MGVTSVYFDTNKAAEPKKKKRKNKEKEKRSIKGQKNKKKVKQHKNETHGLTALQNVHSIIATYLERWGIRFGDKEIFSLLLHPHGHEGKDDCHA